MIPGSLFVLILSLIPYSSPSSGVNGNLLYQSIFNGFLPFIYTFSIEFMFCRWFHAKHRNYRLWGQSIISSTITFSVTYAVAKKFGYPVRLSLIYFFSTCVLCNSVFFYFSMRRARQQGKEGKVFKMKWSIVMSVSLLIGWLFAVYALQVFKNANPWLQSLIAAALAVWKSLITATVKYISLLVSKHGDRFECLDIAMICAAVHWFWTLYSNVAFCQVEEWWTMALYILLDLASALGFLLVCTDRFARYEVVKVSARCRFGVRSTTQKAPTRLIFITDHLFHPQIIPPAPLERTQSRLSLSNLKMYIPKFSLIQTDFTPTPENIASRRYQLLYNTFTFLLVAYGEITFAIYTLLLFICCRNGSNKEYTPVGIGNLPDEKFRQVCYFLYAMISVELATFTAFLWIGPRYLKLDITVYAGEFVKKNWMMLALMPLVLHLPLVTLMFEHSGMGFSIGT